MFHYEIDDNFLQKIGVTLSVFIVTISEVNAKSYQQSLNII